MSTETVVIPTRAILCEVQPVQIAEEVFKQIEEKDKLDDPIDNLEIDRDKVLNEKQKDELKDLLRKHQTIFSTGETDIGQCNLVKHRVDLEQDRSIAEYHRQ